METYHSRSQSFQKTKGSKSASKSARSATLSWPHPETFKATPSTLAEAGFYFNPSKEDPDNVTCFMCEKELGGWESEDDPFDIHSRKCPKCPWVVARCSLANDFDSDGNYSTTDAKRLPTSKIMEKARLDTFRVNEKLWPHDSTKSHGATSKKMASAGFVYTPQVSGDDTATCYYCDLALSGWDKGDDPMEEHRKRESRSGKPCPFFHAQLQSRTKPSSSKPPPADTLTGRKGKTNPMDNEVSSASESDAGVVDVGAAKGKGRTGSSKPPPSRSKPKSSVQKTRSAKTTDEENTEQSELEVAPVKSTGAAKKKKTISQAKPMSPVQEVTQESTEGEAPEPPQTKGKRRGDAKVKPKPPSTRPASSRNTATSSTLPGKQTDMVSEQSEPEDIQQPVKPTKKSTKKPPSSKPLSRAKSTSTLRKTKAENVVDASDQSESEVAAVLALPSKSETSSQPVTRSTETTMEFSDDAQHSEPKDGSPAVEQKKHREKPSSSRPPSRAKSGRSVKPAKTDDEAMEQPGSEVALSEVNTAKKPKKKVSKHLSTAKTGSSERRSAKNSDVEEDDMIDDEEVNQPAPEPKPRGVAKKKQQATETAMQVDEPPTPPPRPPNPEPTDLSEPATPLDPPVVENIATPIEYADIAPPESPALFVPPLASFPMRQISGLSEEERSMTVEQWIRYEMDLQYEQLKRDGERRIEAFKQRAAEVRLRIEAL
ncbi:BIR-domain-containing protein [Rickenella mellea]|uniref:BIR-domain-containing protein n=1 Tax=Rickenella mellea TaxID=50990 RepID=A0A4Y7QBB7_9AGAM|nr:BIR-domain-containing protein [Rickenella mellea]